MATINKKPTKAHKDKKVVKAHRGMAHIPRQRPIGGPSPKRRPTDPQAIPKFAREPVGRARDLLKAKTRGPIAPRPQRPRIQRDSPLIEPAVVQQPIKRRQPPRISDGPLDGGGRRTITPRKLTSRERRRQGNLLKSEIDEMSRQFSKRRRRRLPRIATELFPLPNNFNPPTALTDRFTKPIDRGPMPNARTQRRNKGGDVKKYAVGGLNKGMTKSRTKYGTVDNKKK